jgi:stearoyl-CoA desaturase (delta-9 desaturase)
MSTLKKFYADPYMQIKTTAGHLVFCSMACILFYIWHSSFFYRFHFNWYDLALIPLGIYVGGISAVFIHNASHGSFPGTWLNEAVGHITGIHQLWGFKGWKLIHLVHHQYVDNDDMDPHKHSDLTFWQFCKVMAFRSNSKIRERYQNHWGNTENLQLFKSPNLISALSVLMVIVSLLFWYLLLGPVGFIFFYVPSYIANYMLVTDVNYTAHPKDPQTGDTCSVNLDHNFYYKLANTLWFGIYYHANHHRSPLLFNPKRQTRPARARILKSVG